MLVEYKNCNVFEAAERRMSYIFDKFDNIIVSVSGGKDSTCLWHLAIKEAQKRDRKVKLFFLDQEAEYKSTIDQIEYLMNHPNVEPMWYQVPLNLTNATSYDQIFLDAWFDGRDWIHPKNEIAIQKINKKYPMRFYPFFKWLEKQYTEKTAFLIGLRTKESLNRFRTISNHPGYKGLFWSTKTEGKGAFRFYPIYDWTFGDVWHYIYVNKLRYNELYTKLFLKYGVNMSTMRVSNLIHEKAFRTLADLQEFEPETYERFLNRLKGIHCAAIYAHEDLIYSANKLPETFSTWGEYRDYLLNTSKIPTDKKERLSKRFSRQPDDEYIYKQQAKQILIGDWENNIPCKLKTKKDLREIWWDKF